MQKMRFVIVLLSLALTLSACGKSNPNEILRPKIKAKDTLVFKDGSMMQGIIKSETAAQILIEIDGGEVGFPRSDIAEVRRGETLVKDQSGIQAVFKPAESDAPYPRIYLKNGQMMSGAKIVKEDQTFYLKQAVEGGGFASFGFPVADIERMELWAPPTQKVMDEDFRKLQKWNVKYSFFKSPYHIISTVESSDLVLYFKALQQFYSDFVLNFFDLIDTEKSMGPLAVVIFSSYQQFLEIAGLPAGTNIAGFYIPDKQILFLYNVKEVNMVRFQLAMAAYVGNKLGNAMTNIELYSGQGRGKWQVYDIVEKIQNELESKKMRLEHWARQRTIETIRHEGGHQLLHLLGVDGPEVYRGAWFSEGFAEYMAPENMGDLNPSRLMFMRAEIDAGHTLMPLSYLMSIASGKGVHQLKDPNYTLLGYAQSWALIYFLMQKYPAAFLNYIRELKTQKSDFNADKDKALLARHVGKSIADIEKEFEPFIVDVMKTKLDPEDYDFYRLMQRGLK